MTGDSIMKYGKYKGRQMADVPASYLLWAYESKKCTNEVYKYVEDNLDVIKKQAK